MASDDNDKSFSRGGKWIIAGIIFSFCIGIAFFLTLAMQRSGDLIGPDAAPAHLAPTPVDKPSAGG